MTALNQPENLINHFIDEMLEEGRLQQTRGWLHLPEHKINLAKKNKNIGQVYSMNLKKPKVKPFGYVIWQMLSLLMNQLCVILCIKLGNWVTSRQS